MDARTRHDRVNDLLARAREAAIAGDAAARLRWSEEAAHTALDADEPLAVRSAWRFAKAAHDTQDPAAALRALDHLLALPAALAADEALRALPALTQLVWDHAGYADPRPAEAWAALAVHHERTRDPWLAATARAQQAWHLACAGDHPGLDAIVDRMLSLDPRTFGDGPSRHPDAPDARGSVWWAQLAVLRTAAWSAAWAGRRRRAVDLVDALLDAAEAARVDVAADVWTIDPAARAALAGGEPGQIEALAGAWRARLARLEAPRAPLHRALAAALLDPPSREAAHALGDAADRALADRVGPEWAADAWSRAASVARDAGDADLATAAAARAEALIARFGLGGLRQDPPAR
jgi:hypothetical protein